MDYSTIAAVAISGSDQSSNQNVNVQKIDHLVSRLYFESILKAMDSGASEYGGVDPDKNMYMSLYKTHLVDMLSTQHQLDFGKMMFEKGNAR